MQRPIPLSMRFAAVALVSLSGLLVSLPTSAAPRRPHSPSAEVHGLGGAFTKSERATATPSVDAGASSSSSSSSSGRPTRPIELPSRYNAGIYEPPAPADYEGAGCSRSDGYYGDDDDDIIVFTGDDDDDVATDDDDDVAAPADDDDDTSDDDDDDDDDEEASYVAPEAGIKTRRRPSSPVSRYAFLGVLLAIPLRRRGMLDGHARRRHGSE